MQKGQVVRKGQGEVDDGYKYIKSSVDDGDGERVEVSHLEDRTGQDGTQAPRKASPKGKSGRPAPKVG